MLNSHQESTELGSSSDASSNMYCLRALVAASVLFFMSSASAERYIVADDAFGNTGAKQVSELDADELDKLKGAEPKEVKTADSVEANAGYEDSVASDEPNAQPDQAQSDVDPSEIAASSEPETSSTEQSQVAQEGLSEVTPSKSSEVVSENPFDRALRESQQNETDEVVKRLRAQGGDSTFDATKVNPADFVDSEDLLQGNVNSDGERPFFVTFDNQGESNVIFYSPQVMQDEIKRRESEEQVSDAVIYSAKDDGSQLRFPAGADPVAAQILASGNQPSYFSRFSERCCNKLPNVGTLELRRDKGLHVPIESTDFSYRFVDGDSRYRIVKLPDVRKNFLLTIKTYVKSYKSRGIDHGAFIPQVVLMDRDKNVTRVISNMSAQSHAETWSTYGYLKSVIEVEQSSVDYEALLLVYTRAEDLRKTSTVEDSSGAWEIEHMEIGSLEVTVVPGSL